MDEHIATELAYKNGYEAGYQKAQGEVANKIIKRLKNWYFYEESETLGEVLCEIERKYGDKANEKAE